MVFCINTLEIHLLSYMVIPVFFFFFCFSVKTCSFRSLVTRMFAISLYMQVAESVALEPSILPRIQNLFFYFFYFILSLV